MNSTRFPVVSSMIVICRATRTRFDLDPENVYDVTGFRMVDIAEYVSRITKPDTVINDLQETMTLDEFNTLIRSTGIPYTLNNVNREGRECYVFELVNLESDDEKEKTRQLLLRFLKEMMTYRSRRYPDEYGVIFNAITSLYVSIYGRITYTDTVANREIWNLLFMKRNIPYFINMIKTVDDNGFVRDAYSVEEVFWDGET